MDIVAELRAAVAAHDDWPTDNTRAEVIALARRFIQTIDQRAAVIEQMRHHVTPTEEALSELLNRM
jgi:hypothetical protein